MQLDLFDLISAEDEQVQRVVEEEQLLLKIAERRVALGWDEYEKLKAERSLKVDIKSLPWTQSHPIVSTSGYEHCDIKVIIPPDALSYLDYGQRFVRSRYLRDPVSDACQKLWESYNTAVWKYKPHDVDWSGADDLLSEHRDTGEPIWIRMGRFGERLIPNLAPDCIVEVARLHPVLNI